MSEHAVGRSWIATLMNLFISGIRIFISGGAQVQRITRSFINFVTHGRKRLFYHFIKLRATKDQAEVSLLIKQLKYSVLRFEQGSIAKHFFSKLEFGSGMNS